MAVELLFAAVLLLIAYYDIRCGLIYDKLVLLLALLGCLPLMEGQISGAEACLGSLVGGGFLGTLRYLSRGGLGLGDVKMAAALGLWLGGADIMLCLLLAAVAGLIYGGLMLAARRMERNTPLPFGPFLALGAWLAWGNGDSIRSWLEALLWM